MRDDRVTCTACQHYRAQRCHNARAAQMSLVSIVVQVGEWFATAKQRCHGFKARETK